MPPGQNDQPGSARNSVFQNLIPAKLAVMHWLQTLDTGLFHFIQWIIKQPVLSTGSCPYERSWHGWFIPLAGLRPCDDFLWKNPRSACVR